MNSSVVAEFTRVPTLCGRRAEYRRALTLIGDAAELLVHSIFKRHSARDIRDFRKVVRRSGRKMIKKDIFGGAPSSSMAIRFC
jgi:hypothetical protein